MIPLLCCILFLTILGVCGGYAMLGILYPARLTHVCRYLLPCSLAKAFGLVANALWATLLERSGEKVAFVLLLLPVLLSFALLPSALFGDDLFAFAWVLAAIALFRFLMTASLFLKL